MKYFSLFFLLSLSALSVVYAQNDDDQSYLPLVKETERWISNAAFEVDGGQSWLYCPDSLHLKDQSQPVNLYQGASGIILFYLELFSATGDEYYLTEAQKGAEHLISTLPDTIPSAWDVGFYTGMAGLSYTLEQVYRMSDQKRYRKYALKYLDLIKKAATKTENGIEWGGINDIVYGSAGIGLYLLYASEEMGYKRYKRLAVKAGRGLLDNKTEEGGAVYWGILPELAPWSGRHGTPVF